jgi:ribosome maturation factor RimP
MRATPLENRMTQIIEPVVADMGYDLVLVKIVGEGGSRNVQIMAENRTTKNLGIEDCTQISKAVSAVLDVEDPIEGAYRLEVSSPGIDRPLVRLEDFEKYTGFEAKLETSMPLENGQKRFKGVLKGLEGETILIDTDQGPTQVPFTALTKAKLLLTDALLKATANSK